MKSVQVWTVVTLGVVLALLIAVHALLVQVDFDACFENYANFISPGTPRVERVGEMAPAQLLQATWATIGFDALVMFGVGLLPLVPFLLALQATSTPKSAELWILWAVIAGGLLVVFYGQSLVALFGGSTEFYDCDRNGVSVAILYAPIAWFILSLLATAVLSIVRWFAIPD